MYKERKDNFEVKDVILQISFVVLFVFLLIWLFPTKSFTTKVEKNIDTLLFSENLKTMREAAANYYNGVKIERLPIKVGETAKLTLQEMIDKKLILPFGEESASCDTTKSYVEITKEEVGYVIKTNLKCGTKEDYVLINICPIVCKTCDVKKPIVKPTPKPTPKPVVYEYQYVKRTNGAWSPWSNWSVWSTTVVTANDTRKIETKTVVETSTIEKQVIDRYETTTVKVGTKEVVDHYDVTSVKTGTTQVFDYYRTDKVADGTTTSTSKVKIGTYRIYSTPMYDTATIDYVPQGVIRGTGCNGCIYATNYIYDVYETRTTTTTIYKDVQVAVYKTVDVFTNVSTPVYKTVDIFDTISTPVYKTVTETVAKNVLQYRFATRTYTNGTVSYKWSRSNKDTSLTSIGYSLTGQKRAI